MRSLPATHAVLVKELGGWAPTWDKLVEAAPVPSPFLRSWWLTAVATEAARYLLIFEDGMLVGGLALQLRRVLFGVPVYEFLGAGALCPDHLDLIAMPGREDDVRRCLRTWLARRGSRMLDLVGVAEGSELSLALGPVSTTPIAVAPWEALSDSYADYLADRPPSLRRLERRMRQRLASLDVTHRRVSQAEVPAALNDFDHLQRLRGDRGLLLSQMHRLRPALVAGAAVGEVQIDVLERDGRPVAIAISFRLSGALRMYQSARLLDRELADIGTYLLLTVVEDACGHGGGELDLLRGDEPYKYRFVGSNRTIYRLQACHGGAARSLLTASWIAAKTRRHAGSARRLLARWRDSP